MIRRRPALAVAIVVPIAFALAINSALFSVMDGLLFRPLPLKSPEELASITYRRVDGQVPQLAYLPALEPERERLRAAVEECPLVVGVTHVGVASNLDSAAREMGVQAVGVDFRFFRLLGLVPVLGVDFRPEDALDVTAKSNTLVSVIISHRLWQAAFGGDRGVLGTRELLGRHVRIVGVMGPRVKFPDETDVWVAIRPAHGRTPAYARLAPNATVDQLSERFPTLEITPLASAIRPDGSRGLVVLLGAACLLLLVAWVQVSALAFAGAVGRLHELGIRLALGSGRMRLVRQFGVENALLATMAFALAWLAAQPLTTFVVSTLPSELSRGQYLAPDVRTFLFLCVMSLAGLAFLTAFPVAVIRRTSPLRLLQGGLGETPFMLERFRQAMIVTQVALTASLLYLSGLTVHSFVRAATFDYGFDSKRVLLFTPPVPSVNANVDLGKFTWSTDPGFEARSEEKHRRILESLESLRDAPGVIAAASFYHVPLITRGSRMSTSEAGRSDPHWDDVSDFAGRPVLPSIRVRSNAASRDFLRALGATLVAGRTFDDPEYVALDNVVVVNETLARRLVTPLNVAGNELHVSVIGRTMTLSASRSRRRIIGVIRDLVYSTPAEPSVPQLFEPDLRGRAAGIIAIRTRESVDATLPAIRVALDRVWGDLPNRHFTLLRDAWHTALVPFRGKATLLSLIGWLCVPLAGIGLMGAVQYSVKMRSRETAIRIALGADPILVRRAVVFRALLVVAIGIAAGIGLGVAAGRAISNHLFNVQPADPWTMAAVTSALIGLGWLAALAPARQASHIEPAAALRHD
jgi:putative ABC transport system permease protein